MQAARLTIDNAVLLFRSKIFLRPHFVPRRKTSPPQ